MRILLVENMGFSKRFVKLKKAGLKWYSFRWGRSVNQGSSSTACAFFDLVIAKKWIEVCRHFC